MVSRQPWFGLHWNDCGIELSVTHIYILSNSEPKMLSIYVASREMYHSSCDEAADVAIRVVE